MSIKLNSPKALLSRRQNITALLVVIPWLYRRIYLNWTLKVKMINSSTVTAEVTLQLSEVK